MSTFKILVVCVGNICRSPLAERLLTLHLNQRMGETADTIEVSSGGIAALVGDPMDEQAAAQLRRLGGSPRGFTATQVQPRMVERADLVLTATRPLRSSVLEEAPRALKHTFTIREFSVLTLDEATYMPAPVSPIDAVQSASARRGSAAVPDYDIPDPIGRPMEFHRAVAELINTECEAISRVIAGFGHRRTQ